MTSQISNLTARVRERINRMDPAAAFRALIAENNAKTLSADLDNGRELVTERALIHTELVRHWFLQHLERSGYDRPVALAAIGGTGRLELNPLSDKDFIILCDDSTGEDNRLLQALRQDCLHSDAFAKAYGFSISLIAYNLEDTAQLSGKELNAFLDLWAIHPQAAPDGADLVTQYRTRIQRSCDPFAHFKHLRNFWRDHLAQPPGAIERLDGGNLKTDALRIFQAGVWTLAGKNFLHSHDIHRLMGEDLRDLDAYYFLLRLRAIFHLRYLEEWQAANAGQADAPAWPYRHDELERADILRYDFVSRLGNLSPRNPEWFGDLVRSRLLSSLRRVVRYGKSVIQSELKSGRRVRADGDIFLGSSGLYHAAPPPNPTPRDKTRALLDLLLEAQRHGLPFDHAEYQGTLRRAADWCVRDPHLADLFYTPGDLALTLEQLADLDVLECMFPGYALFEASLDERVQTEKTLTRGRFSRDKVALFEGYAQEGAQLLDGLAKAAAAGRPAPWSLSVPMEAALLDADRQAGIKLALAIKRLPSTLDQPGVSDLPLDMYRTILAENGFNEKAIETAAFCIENQRLLVETVRNHLNDDTTVKLLLSNCGDEETLRSLYVFTYADRIQWRTKATAGSEWLLIDELYTKAHHALHPDDRTPFKQHLLSLDPETYKILSDFGESLIGGHYRQPAATFAYDLLAIHQAERAAKARSLRQSGSHVLGVAARDYRGLAAVLAGTLFHHGQSPQIAHLFSAMNFGLALDFFHLPKQPSKELLAAIEQAVDEHRFIAESDEASLPSLPGRVTLSPYSDAGICRLRYEADTETPGLVYALTYKIYRHLRGNIFGLAAYSPNGKPQVSVFFDLPKDESPLTLEQAREIIGQRF